MNITFENLKELFGAEAEAKYAEICAVGGFGTVSQAHEGGLDVSGLPAEAQKKIDAIMQPKQKTIKGDKD